MTNTDKEVDEILELVINPSISEKVLRQSLSFILLTKVAEARREALEEALGMIEETDLAIRKSDKTPKYEYSRNRCDANNDGEFPGAGQRWAMPRELSSTLVSRVAAKLSALIEEQEK